MRLVFHSPPRAHISAGRQAGNRCGEYLPNLKVLFLAHYYAFFNVIFLWNSCSTFASIFLHRGSLHLISREKWILFTLCTPVTCHVNFNIGKTQLNFYILTKYLMLLPKYVSTYVDTRYLRICCNIFVEIIASTYIGVLGGFPLFLLWFEYKITLNNSILLNWWPEIKIFSKN